MLQFENLLSPLPLKTFVEDYWSKEYLYLSNSKSRYVSLFSWTDYNQIINNSVCNLSMRLVKEGETLVNNRLLKGPIKFDKDFVNYCREHRATVVLDQTELYHHRLKQLCKNFHAKFKEPVQINSYCSFTNVQGFSVHKDEQDVFIMQIEGEKEWKLYGFANEEPSEVLRTINLKKGDLLYLPKGYWHAAIARKQEPSLHLTFTVTRHRYSEVLQWLINGLFEEKKLKFSDDNLPQLISGSGELDYDFSLIKKQMSILLDNLSKKTADGLEGFIKKTKAKREVDKYDFTDFQIENDIHRLVENYPIEAYLIKGFHQYFIEELEESVFVFAAGHKLEFPKEALPLIQFLFSVNNPSLKDIFEFSDEFYKEDIQAIVQELVDHQIFFIRG